MSSAAGPSPTQAQRLNPDIYAGIPFSCEADLKIVKAEYPQQATVVRLVPADPFWCGVPGGHRRATRGHGGRHGR